MSKTAIITARLDEDVSALVDRIAKAQGRSRSWFAAQAIERAARAEADYMAFVQEGVDAIAAGDFVEHDVVMAELDTMIAELEAQCSD